MAAGGTIELPFPSAKLAGHYPDELVADLMAAYSNAGSSGFVGLKAIADKWGKSPSALSRKAKSLGLPTSYSRMRVISRKDTRKYGDLAAFRKVQPAVAKKWIAERGHPRGMLGKAHTQEARDRSRAAAIAWWASLTPEEKEKRVDDNLRAALAKNGRLGPKINKRETTWKAGWREIGDRRHYFRSRWEANYARYLQWLKQRGEILDWEYEPETFWFEGIKRGVRSYLPDFRIHELSGSKPIHEVKGWMCPRSKTTLKRMAKYHPDQTIILIRQKDYNAIARSVGPMIEDWE